MNREQKRRAGARARQGNAGAVVEVDDRDCKSMWSVTRHVHMPQNPLVWKGVERVERRAAESHKEAMKQAKHAGNYERVWRVKKWTK